MKSKGLCTYQSLLELLVELGSNYNHQSYEGQQIRPHENWTQQKTRPVFGCTTAIVFNDFGCEWKRYFSFEVLRKPPNCESEVAGIRGEIDGIQLIFNY